MNLEGRAPLLFTSYFPPIEYFSFIRSGEVIYIEEHEHFVKQTYRNRCHIATSNGLLKLTVPIKHRNKEHTKIKDVRISHDYNWQKLHWRSIESGYRSSPFFEFYESDIYPLFEIKYEYLIDLNKDILKCLLKLLKLSPIIRYTEAYEKNFETLDLRASFSSKKHNSVLPEYYQVFGDKIGFISGLSILDLLFNMGPKCDEYITNLKLQKEDIL